MRDNLRRDRAIQDALTHGYPGHSKMTPHWSKASD
jgi:hypothetical protein